jgi:RNA polymerase sigma-70 factor, ECF subfamily
MIRETFIRSALSFYFYDGSRAVKRDGRPGGENALEDAEYLAERFEAARPRLQRIAQRILGSASESDDALQESWLRISRADVADVANLQGWLTTVVARVCFDALKWRETRREELTPDDPRRDTVTTAPGERPEEEAVLADSIGVALLILLDTIPPAERVAFVLHDTFDVPFDDIGAIVGRTPEAARQLASRARRRVRGASAGRDTVKQRHDELVRAFLAASRAGNFSALIAMLDPGATLRADAAVMAMGGAAYWQNDRLELGIEGADAVAQTFSRRASAAQPVLIDGEPGAVWMHAGELRVVFRFRVAADRITAIELVADPTAIAQLVIDASVE